MLQDTEALERPKNFCCRCRQAQRRFVLRYMRHCPASACSRPSLMRQQRHQQSTHADAYTGTCLVAQHVRSTPLRRLTGRC